MSDFITIPAGKFVIKDGIRNGSPLYVVYLDTYAIGRCPVTNAQYAKFIETGGYEKREYWIDELGNDEGWEAKEKEGWKEPAFWKQDSWNYVDHPIVGVSWLEAAAYCRWTGQKLPTEAQWVKAARGGIYLDGDTLAKLPNPFPMRDYPWGNAAPNAEGIWRANYYKTYVHGTSPVGHYPAGASPYGCLDMAGNVWEWCSDWYDKNHYRTMPETNPSGPKNGSERVLLGGSWLNDDVNLRVGNRYRYPPPVRVEYVSFRVVWNTRST